MVTTHGSAAKRSIENRPEIPAVEDFPTLASSSTRWLLLIHQIPPKPDYLRVKIGRRLQRVGAVPIKNSVYVLPRSVESLEDFQWIVREIEDGGGEAFISESSFFGDGLTDQTVQARFDAARTADYRGILADARSLLSEARRSATVSISRPSKAASAVTLHAAAQNLAKLRRRYETVRGIDFFAAADGPAVVALLSEIELVVSGSHRGKHNRSVPLHVEGATWVTRRDIHVDRVASAWLIRHFIDQRARFLFVDPAQYAQHAAEIRFDMFEAEYTHVGDACTFETLLTEFSLDDSALREIAQIVHDADCKDTKYGREEALGLTRIIAGIAARFPRDDDRVERGAMVFDDLYAAFGGKLSG